MVRQEFCGYRVIRFSRIPAQHILTGGVAKGGGGAYFAFDLDATPSGVCCDGLGGISGLPVGGKDLRDGESKENQGERWRETTGCWSPEREVAQGDCDPGRRSIGTGSAATGTISARLSRTASCGRKLRAV
jgi:hypothetical protein